MYISLYQPIIFFPSCRGENTVLPYISDHLRCTVPYTVLYRTVADTVHCRHPGVVKLQNRSTKTKDMKTVPEKNNQLKTQFFGC